MNIGDTITDGSVIWRLKCKGRKADELIIEYVNKIHCPIKILDDGSKFIRVYIYTAQNGAYFKNIGDVMNCYSGYAFSKLDQLDKFRSVDGYYEFILTYPDQSSNKYNRWKQVNSPYSNNTEYIPIHMDYIGYNGALHRHLAQDTCIFKTDPNNSWFAPVGQLTLWENGNSIPMADGNKAYQCELWVRVDNV